MTRSAGWAARSRLGPALALLCLSLLPGAALCGQEDDTRAQPTLASMRLERFLGDAGARASEYFELFTDLTAEETKTVELFDSSGAVSRQRRIVSDFIVYQSQRDSSSVAEYRNVREVDGSSIGERQERLGELLASQSRAKTIRDELARVSREGARYDLDHTISGLTITQGLPLQPWARSFFNFSVGATARIGDREAHVIAYEQTAPNPRFGFKFSLPAELKASHALYRGRLWVDSQTAQVLREEREVTASPTAGGEPVVIQRTEFFYTPSRFGVPLPRRIVFTSLLRFERGTDGALGSSPLYRLTFDYGPFKRFTASGDYVAAAPVDPSTGHPGRETAPPVSEREAMASRLEPAEPSTAAPVPATLEPDWSLGPEFAPGAPEGPVAPEPVRRPTRAALAVRPPLPIQPPVQLPPVGLSAVRPSPEDRPRSRRAVPPAAPPPEIRAVVRPPVASETSVRLPTAAGPSIAPTASPERVTLPVPPARRIELRAVRPPLPREREVPLPVVAAPLGAPHSPSSGASPRVILPRAPAPPTAPLRAAARPPRPAQPIAMLPGAPATPLALPTGQPTEIARVTVPPAPPQPELGAVVRPPVAPLPSAPLPAGPVLPPPPDPGADQPDASPPAPGPPILRLPTARQPPRTAPVVVALPGEITFSPALLPSAKPLAMPPPLPAPSDPIVPADKPRRTWRPPPS